MPTRRQNRRNPARRNKKHALSTGVVSSRIVFLTFLRKTKHFLIYSVVTCLLVLLCWGLVLSARKLITGGERFQLEAIVISPTPDKNAFFNYQNIPEITGLEVQDNIFSHNLGDIEAKLEAYPELKKATLARQFPGTIEITLVERNPVAKLSYKGKDYLVTESGLCYVPQLKNTQVSKSLPQLITYHKSDLPFQLESKVIDRIGLERALELAKLWSEHVSFGEKIKSVKVKDLHSLEVLTETGAVLTFGYYEHERQLQDYNTILHYANERRVKVESANLLPFENIPVIFDESESLPRKVEVIAPKKKVNTDLMKILNQG